eukprot:scaffold431_cov334-Pavlova_lutheri.AAC.23
MSSQGKEMQTPTPKDKKQGETASEGEKNVHRVFGEVRVEKRTRGVDPEGAVQVNNWTEEEDEILSRMQKKFGNRWSIVAKHIPGRNGQQCAQRWRHKVNPEINRDKWTLEEDKALLEMYAKYPGKWAQIANALPGRTDQQCMGRYLRHLDPNIRRDIWSKEEDEKLLSLKVEHGTKWSAIARNIQGRTPQQCRARWFTLTGSKQGKPHNAPRSIELKNTTATAKEWPSPKQTLGNLETSKKRKSNCPPTETQRLNLDGHLPQKLDSLRVNSLQSSPTTSTSPRLREFVPITPEGHSSPTLSLQHGASIATMQGYVSPLSPMQVFEPIRLTEQHLTTLDCSTPSVSGTLLDGAVAYASQPNEVPVLTRVSPMQFVYQRSPVFLETFLGHPHVDVDSPEWASLRVILGGAVNEAGVSYERLEQWRNKFQQPASPLGPGNQQDKDAGQTRVMISQDLLSPPQLLNNGISYQGAGIDGLNLSGS